MPTPSGPARLERIAPVFYVIDIDQAVDLYRRLGFVVDRYQGAEPYAFAQRDDVHLHLQQADGLDPLTSMVSVYVYVDDATALHQEWSDADVPGRLARPRRTDYGLLEGSYVDPDGNLMRFGSPL